MQRRRMMFTRLHFCAPTSTLAGLLFSSSSLSSSSYAAMSTQSSNQVEGSRSFLSVNIHTAQGSTAEKISPLETIANQDISCTSTILLKQSGDGKECSSLSLGYTTTSVTEHQPGGTVQSDQLLEPVLQRDDDILYSTGFTRMLEEHCLPTSFGKKELYKYRNLRSVHHGSEHVTPGSRNKKSKYHNIHKTRIVPEPFDIYQCETEESDTEMNGSREIINNTEEPRVVERIQAAQGSTAEKISLLESIANQDISCTSTILLKQSGDGKDCSSLSLGYTTTSVTEHQPGGTVQSDQLLEPVLQRDDDILYSTGFTRMLEEHCLPTSFGKKELYKYRNLRSVHHGSEHVTPGSRNKKSKYHNIHKTRIVPEPFDIYQCETEESDTEMNGSREINNNTEEPRVVERIQESMQSVPRPGMVLLKKYISPEEQVSIIRKCRELGLGPGGFYQPGYKNGWKLRLRMMCLGLDWDPQTRKYQKRRRIDKARPPDIPSEFRLLVTRAMEESLSLTRKIFNSSNAEKILPQMTPDICIVNFYTETGRLGLHQDRDESEESLSKGLPVVSFSIGDTAEFMYGDKRDANEANKLELESGDVLIFGGESRHVFHGISSIIPHSAPDFLREHTMLRCGRLNLTFRRY